MQATAKQLAQHEGLQATELMGQHSMGQHAMGQTAACMHAVFCCRPEKSGHRCRDSMPVSQQSLMHGFNAAGQHREHACGLLPQQTELRGLQCCLQTSKSSRTWTWWVGTRLAQKSQRLTCRYTVRWVQH